MLGRLYLVAAVGILGVAGTATISGFKACDPCAEKCNIPCNTPNAGLPVVWDNTPQEAQDTAISHGEIKLNPYNSLRPEYRDAPPSQADLSKIWQHHMADHSYKTPFVRPMKSGLWEAGVPNRYAPSGYNRRKFNDEASALEYVRHKTGAGSSIGVGNDDGAGISNDMTSSTAEIAGEPMSDEPMPSEVSASMGHNFGTGDAEEMAELIESAATSRSGQPTSDEDLIEKAASKSTLPATDIQPTADEMALRKSRDHGLKIAHKMRDFLANYRPEHEVKVVGAGMGAA